MGGGHGGFDRLASALTALLAIVILSVLTGLVLSSRGNLAWDDADYLRRGLSNARFAEAGGPLLVLPRAIDRLLLEQPKPPWFVGWIELGVHAIGRSSVDLLILFSTIVPYSFLLLAVVLTGRWLRGAWGGLLALVCLAASPLSLAFGEKVMVETFLALWILLVYTLTAHFVTAPSRRIATALGLAVGLALLTKLTTAIFLPAPLLYVCVHIFRNRALAPLVLKRLGLALAICVAVAGPWYAKHAGPAIRFALFSSRYNEVATGTDRVPAARRAAEMLGDLAGWPLCGTVAASVLAAGFWGRKKPPEIDEQGNRVDRATICFTRIAWLGAGIAAAVLMIPAYFDTRFLLPIWPVLAVAIAASVSSYAPRLPAVPKTLVGLGFAGSLVLALLTVAREPSFTTYWQTTGMIDELVKQYGVSNLLNVGNCAAWNVCKTGLMNELRDDPGSCFVLHDLTRATEARAERLLEQADGVLVLGRSDLPDAVMQLAPGLNRGYSAVVEKLTSRPDFRQVGLPARDGLPELLLFVRQVQPRQARETSKSEIRRRR